MSLHLARTIRDAFLSLTLVATCTQLGAQTNMDRDLEAAMLRIASANTSAADQGAVALGPRKAGTKRIGIMTPVSDLGSSESANSIGEMESQFLAGPTVEVVRLAARLPMQAYAEARSMDCDFMLTSAVTQKKSKGGFGVLKTLSAVAPMASMIPGLGAAAAITSIATAQSMAMASSLAASNIKARANISFDYSLLTLGGTAVLGDAQKSKAKSDGDDVLTPMVQQAASRIVSLLVK